MNLDIWSIAILIIIFQGVFLLLVLLISTEKRTKRGNIYLFFIILVLIWYLIEFLLIRNTVNVKLGIFYGTRYGSWFLLGPLTLYYFLSITDITWKWKTKSLIHFLPFILFVVIIPLCSDDIINKRQVDYGMLSVFDHRKKSISLLQYMYSFIFIIQFVHLGVYLFKNIKRIKTYTETIKSEYATVDIGIKWARVFNMILIIVLLFSILFLYILLVTDIYRRYLDYIYVLPIGSLFFLISYSLMNTDWKSIDQNIEKYAKSSLKTENIIAYVKQLNLLMGDKKIYLNNEIRLLDVAKQMDIPSHHVSQIINEHFKSSFFDFINKYRVEEAKNRIVENPKYTLLQIAFDSGFNNKTSFVNAFKKFENKTPSAFRKEHTDIL
ncbi:helix-turn-helix domain-containing protein [Aquimarina sp. AU474]|uniref:helix-turn-helix domain-containing protein n=1 Tax=Aquimarina sp. AU474 TaxID=2108529 RepID=UPI000D697BDB|nr:helix-turn-helix domain-containing protein [Aquimarina sp. AU474]